MENIVYGGNEAIPPPVSDNWKQVKKLSRKKKEFGVWVFSLSIRNGYYWLSDIVRSRQIFTDYQKYRSAKSVEDFIRTKLTKFDWGYSNFCCITDEEFAKVNFNPKTIKFCGLKEFCEKMKIPYSLRYKELTRELFKEYSEKYMAEFDREVVLTVEGKHGKISLNSKNEIVSLVDKEGNVFENWKEAET